MSYEVIFFDLDDCIYPSSCGLWDAIGDRISLYMTERLHIPPEEARHRREQYFRSFGTTLTGLMRDYQVDPGDYMDFVHDLPLDQYLRPDLELAAMLASLPQRKYILTNADRPHAERVLAKLGVRNYFLAIVDIHALGLANKPQPEAYRLSLAIAGDPAPTACVLVEDSLRNLQPAHEIGMTTVYLGRESPGGYVDVVLTRLTDLCRALPALNCRAG